MSANRFVASGGTEGSVTVSVAGQRHSVIKGILTCVTVRHRRTPSHERSGKESIRLINDKLKQNS